MVFISAHYVDMSVCAQLLTLWLDMAMNTLMTTPRTQDLKCWFFIDELGALHRLPALEKGLQTARNFGGAIVLGLHAYAKLKEVYGENMAMTLSSLARTKLILGTADRETATWCSDFIGHGQVRDMEEAYTYGYNNARDAVSLTPRKHIEPLLLPDQLMNLPRLSGYLKFPDGFPAAPVKLKPLSRPKGRRDIHRPRRRSTRGRDCPGNKARRPISRTESRGPSRASILERRRRRQAGRSKTGCAGAQTQRARRESQCRNAGAAGPCRRHARRPYAEPSGTQGSKAGDAPVQPDRAASGVAFPKDALLRASAASGQQGLQTDPKGPGRPDAPPASVPAHRSPAIDKAAESQKWK